MSRGNITRKTLLTLADWCQLTRTYRYVKRRILGSEVLILLYHNVTPGSVGWLTGTVRTEIFEKQLSSICKGYEVISLEILHGYLADGRSLPGKAAVITFDDGYLNNYEYAFPVLNKLKVPATIFLATGYISTESLFWWDEVRYMLTETDSLEVDLGIYGSYSLRTPDDRSKAEAGIMSSLKMMPDHMRNDVVAKLRKGLKIEITGIPVFGRLLNWDQVREMYSCGISFGAHTVNHPILTSLSYREAEREIVQSKRDIEDQLGHPVNSFAYPGGRYTNFDLNLANMVRDNGFSCALTGIPRWVTGKSNFYQLGRIPMSENIMENEIMLSGLYGDLRLYRIL